MKQIEPVSLGSMMLPCSIQTAELHSHDSRISCDSQALLNPATSVLIHKCYPYTGKLNSEMSGDSTTRFYIVEMF